MAAVCKALWRKTRGRVECTFMWDIRGQIRPKRAKKENHANILGRAFQEERKACANRPEVGVCLVCLRICEKAK